MVLRLKRILLRKKPLVIAAVFIVSLYGLVLLTSVQSGESELHGDISRRNLVVPTAKPGVRIWFKEFEEPPPEDIRNIFVVPGEASELGLGNRSHDGFGWEKKLELSQSAVKNMSELLKTVKGRSARLSNKKKYRSWAVPYRPMDKAQENAKNTSGLNIVVDPDDSVHLFYYMWYGNPEFDQNYLHWNHAKLPHWNKDQARRWPQEKHFPPDDIGANFYPALGPYSSQNPEVMTEHMRQVRLSGAGVLAVSWYPPGQADDNGNEWDRYINQLMDIAATFEIKICFHIEPYKDRSVPTMRSWIKYIVDKYGDHPAFYRFSWKGVDLPLYYVYDSYHMTPEEWAELLTPSGSKSIRKTAYDGLFIGLLVDMKHKEDIYRGGFNGYYTYFASNKFTYGSSPGHWENLAVFADKHDLIFIPSVGPGYIDTEVRPWNGVNTKSRRNGDYYRTMFREAIKLRPYVISITSFNEWHEGTQIEAAVPHARGASESYLDYKPDHQEFYLNLTRSLVKEYEANVGERHCCGTK